MSCKTLVYRVTRNLRYSCTAYYSRYMVIAFTVIPTSIYCFSSNKVGCGQFKAVLSSCRNVQVCIVNMDIMANLTLNLSSSGAHSSAILIASQSTPLSFSAAQVESFMHPANFLVFYIFYFFGRRNMQHHFSEKALPPSNLRI